MKKYIEISEEVLVRLREGKFVEGSLHVDGDTKKVVFKAYNRLSRTAHQPAVLLCETEHGWVKQSKKRNKYYSSVPSSLGLERSFAIFNRELREAASELLTY